MATIKDVAKHSGVSTSLVSKALNGYTDIKEETRQKILRSVNELGYVPNASASALSKKTKTRVAIIIKSYQNSNTEYFIDEISHIYSTSAYKMCLEMNLDVFVIYDDILQGKSDVEITNYLLSHNISGIILFGISDKDDAIYSIYKNQRFKKVILDAPIINETTSSITIDDVQAQLTLLNEIYSNDHKKYLYLSGPNNSIIAIQRRLAMESFAKQYNIDVQYECTNFDIQQAYDKIKSLDILDHDYIVCANDMMAIGVCKALKHKNININVSGFDGIKALNIIDKQIPTIVQNFELKAQSAVIELKKLLEGKESEQIIIDYKFEKILSTNHLK